MSTSYRCRKCRQILEIQDAIVEDCTIIEEHQQSVLFLDVYSCPKWIRQEVEAAAWVKGKLACCKCKGRLGSFDFVNQKLCACKQHVLPAVHFLFNRIDCIEKRDISATKVSKVSSISLSEETKSDSGIGLSFLDSFKNVNENVDGAVSLQDISLDVTADNIAIKTFKQDEDSLITKCTVSQIRTGGFHPPAAGRKKPFHFLDDATAFHSSGIGQPPTTSHDPADVPCTADERILVDFEDCNKFSCLTAGLEDNLPDVDADSSTNVTTDGADKLDDINIPLEMVCAVCLEMFYRPHRCDPCGHVFCETCLCQLRIQKPSLTRCPLCRDIICTCVFQADLNNMLKYTYKKHFTDRHDDVRKKLKARVLPSCSPAQYKRLKQKNQHNNARQWSYRTDQNSILARCARDILVRVVWLLLMFICHNILLSVDHWMEWRVYAEKTMEFNNFLLTLACKLILFGIIYCLKKCLRVSLETQFTGQAVLFVCIFSVLWDTDSWLQFMLNVMVLGSLFL